ncbi:TIGR04282 family arsenosugar biosynthesis glycosyltransferase [Maricaulaceae bacterium NA33B04]|nr:TIGR04282 family arsenosugar biosynthesis glycosyltransferase [Maricaulaceae bacterium NA33B04]
MKLVLFAKAPVIGGAKTRLAAGIGKVEAWRRHRAMSARIIRKLKGRRWRTVLAVSPDRAMDGRYPGVWPQRVNRVPQGSGDLGTRQARAFAERGPVCVIGTDAPDVRRADIAQAFKALKRHDAVIGPAEDGGYWLLALNGPAPSKLFDAVRWSHAETRADLEARLRACGLWRIAYLRGLRDIDVAEDLGR